MIERTNHMLHYNSSPEKKILKPLFHIQKVASAEIYMY